MLGKLSGVADQQRMMLRTPSLMNTTGMPKSGAYAEIFSMGIAFFPLTILSAEMLLAYPISGEDRKKLSSSLFSS